MKRNQRTQRTPGTTRTLKNAAVLVVLGVLWVLSAALAHMANHSYRLGKITPQGEIAERIKGNAHFIETFERMITHLKDNKLDADLSKIVLGPMLTMDPATEKYTGDFAAEANKLDMEHYRKEFSLPPV